MLPPPPLVPAARYLLNRYNAVPVKAKKLLLGYPRLGLLTVPYNNNPAYRYGGTEFFTGSQDGFYSADRTLRELTQGGNLAVMTGHKLLSFEETSDYVVLHLYDVQHSTQKTIRARHLLLALGTIHTTKLLLTRNNDFDRQLPFIDHPPTLLPMFIPKMFGSEFYDNVFPIQLTATSTDCEHRDMISIYYPCNILWSDFLTDVPLPFTSSVQLLGSLLGGMLVAMIWENSYPAYNKNFRLTADGSVEIRYPGTHRYSGIKKLTSALRDMGVLTYSGLASASIGRGFHYAGTLPMRHHPDFYETYPDGRLWNSGRVRVIDGSVFPSLPAKNHSLTLMANAARIAEETLRCDC
jgi:choline dehydrogenase-like flavoprotein